MLVSLSPEVALQVWAGEYIAYDRASGDTRLLDQLAASIIELILIRPRSLDEVQSILLQQQTDIPTEEWRVEIETCLANLLSLGVIHAHSKSSA